MAQTKFCSRGQFLQLESLEWQYEQKVVQEPEDVELEGKVEGIAGQDWTNIVARLSNSTFWTIFASAATPFSWCFRRDSLCSPVYSPDNHVMKPFCHMVVFSLRARAH